MKYPFFELIRPKQWLKNLVIYAYPLFQGFLFLHKEALIQTSFAFVIFCILSSSIYIINDILDLESDRQHPLKSKRPLASGRFSVPKAFLFAFILLAIALSLSLNLGRGFFVICFSYCFIMILYSFWLKYIKWLNVLVISFGFVIRALAGVIINKMDVPIIFLVCIMLGALLLALGKRRCEWVLLNKNNREINGFNSNLRLIDRFILIVGIFAMTAYIYFIYIEITKNSNTPTLIYTIPFIFYGVFRYLQLIHGNNQICNHEEILLKDKFLIYNSISLVILTSLIKI